MSENTATLLIKKKVYHENCPGCKIDQINEVRKGIPYKEFLYIWLVSMCTVLPISSLFPFIYFMVRDFHIAKIEEDIAFYVGFVGSSFMVGRALTSIFWGTIADRFGRKPVILLGSMSVVVFNTLFGFSTNFWMAVSMRFLLGCFNGVLGPIRAYASEVCREEHRAIAQSVSGTSRGVGLVIGPAIGGFFAQPAEKYPNIFSQDSLFGRYPYLLPCLLMSLFSLGVSVASCWLPETLHMHNKNKNESCNSSDALEDSSCGTNEKNDVEGQESVSSSKRSLFKNRFLMSTIILYCVISLHEIAYSEVFSLWAVSAKKYGGLSFTSQDVGEVLAISGLGLLLFQLLLYPPVEKIFGAIVVCRLAALISIPLLASYPFIAMLSGFNLQFIIINCASLLKNILSVSILTGLFLMMNNAVPQHQRGAANGLSMTAMSVFKAIGPAAAGALFSWSQKRQFASFLPALPISSLFPFIYFMVRDFNIAKREEDIGFYVGFIGSSYMVGRALTSMFWGVVADRYGRKPIILIGTISVVVFNTLFGFSTSFWMAISMRFLLGCFNGVLGPIRAYASEVCRKEYRALAQSVSSSSRGIGLVIGPAIGGFFAQPAEKYPTIFSEESLFGRFPYLLPCLLISLLALGVSIAACWLPETMHMHIENKNEQCNTSDALEHSSFGSNEKDDIEEQRKESSSKISLLKNWPLMSTIILYCVISLHEIAYSEIFSLWAVSDKKYGGLSFTSQDVGEVLAISGLGLLLFQFFLYARVEKILGPVMVARLAGLLSIPLLSCYPFIAMLSGLSLQLIINCASILKNVLSVSINTGVLILMNNSVPQHQRGSANGISMTAMSIFKAFGPAGGGALFSWAQKRQSASFLPGDHMVFFILNIVHLIGVVLTFKPFLAQPRIVDTA